MREWSEAGGATNAVRPLTHSSDLTREGLAMKATRICKAEDCTRPTRTRRSAVCDKHARHVLRGTPFWDRVNVVDDHDSCWEWQAGTSGREGRGLFTLNGEQQLAYRVAWQLEVGPIPDGMHVCHHCDNPACVRPSHLFLGDHTANMHDGYAKGRIKPPSNGPRGATHHDATATDEQVAEARRIYAEGGISQRALAERYGVAQTTIGHWVRGQSRRSA